MIRCIYIFLNIIIYIYGYIYIYLHNYVGIVLTGLTAFQNPAVPAAPMDEVKRPRVAYIYIFTYFYSRLTLDSLNTDFLSWLCAHIICILCILCISIYLSILSNLI